MAFTMEKLIELCLSHRVETVQGHKGTTKVIPISEQPDAFMQLFVRMKEEGYTADDLTTTHLRRIASACLPKHVKGKDKTDWDNRTLWTLLVAEAAVFPTPYSPGAPQISDEEKAFYHERFQLFADLFRSKYLNQEKDLEPKHSPKTEEVQVPDSDFDDSDDVNMGEDEASFPHPESKPYDPEVFKEPMPTLIEDDFSWLPKRAK